MVPRSATSATSAVLGWIWCAQLGAMGHGAETLNLGAVCYGADLLSPETENVSLKIYL